jgi:hypothetical protein
MTRSRAADRSGSRKARPRVATVRTGDVMVLSIVTLLEIIVTRSADEVAPMV